MVKRKTCIFISGQGSNLNNHNASSRDYNFPIKISLVICNNPNAPGILLAKRNLIPHVIVNTQKRNFENNILIQLKQLT